MSISKELFLAILSMDAYNRGYKAGIADGTVDPDGLGEVGGIGSATIIRPESVGRDDPTYRAWQAASFYAVAYTVGDGVDGIAPGTTVIAYRGRTMWHPRPTASVC